MSAVSYLIRRGAMYYCRMRVPLDLVEVWGRRELIKTLGTRDLADAKRLMLPVLTDWNRQFDDLRTLRRFTDADKPLAVWEHYQAALTHDETARTRLPTEADIDAATERAVKEAERIGMDARDPLEVLNVALEARALKKALTGPDSYLATARRVKLDHIKRHLAQGETALINHEVDDYLSRNSLFIPAGSPDRDILARQMMRAEIEALQRGLERDAGDYTGVPRDPIIEPPAGRSATRAAPGEGIMDIFEIYAAENPRNTKKDTLDQARRDIGTFLEIIGASAPVTAINKIAVRDWKALLIKYPVRGSEIAVFKDMTMAQTVTHNDKIKKPVLTTRTVNRYLSSLMAFCRWLVNNGYLEHNPVDNMLLAKGKQNGAIPFTVEQMNLLFRSPLFTGCKAALPWSHMARPGNVMIRDYIYWVPLIMLYSGARPAEIAQLEIADVKQEHGQWIMHITSEGDDKSVKTKGSTRVIPVHKELIKLGFLDYLTMIKNQKQAKLFPTAVRNERGQMISDYSREFGKYLQRIGLKDGRGLSLYSFRHGATDALRRAGHLDEEFGFMLGHGKATMTGRYGAMPQGMIEKRVMLINSINYPGLDLSNLISKYSVIV